jgi:CHASE3 domain sensor protein
VPGNRSRKRQYLEKYQRKTRQLSRRADQITRMLVDIGVHYASTLGASKAALFLRVKNVSESVIARVLHRAQKRRKP